MNEYAQCGYPTVGQKSTTSVHYKKLKIIIKRTKMKTDDDDELSSQ